MIDVVKIDHWAASGDGPLHRASPLSKVISLFFVIAAAVIAQNPFPLMFGYGLLLLVAAAARLPLTRIAILSWYGALFAILYAFSLRATAGTVALFIIKAITPAFAVLMLIVSTPYPRIFALLSMMLPEILAAGLFMTYRTLFILLDMMGNFGAALRLRGGFSPGSLYKNSANISRGIGMLLVRAVERATRLYAVMVVRGYNGSMAEPGKIMLQSADWLPLSAGTAVLVLVIVWR